MAGHTVETSRDWLRSPHASVVACWIPGGAIIAGLFGPVPLRTVVWTIALFWMGTACILNATRCGGRPNEHGENSRRRSTKYTVAGCPLFLCPQCLRSQRTNNDGGAMPADGMSAAWKEGVRHVRAAAAPDQAIPVSPRYGRAAARSVFAHCFRR